MSLGPWLPIKRTAKDSDQTGRWFCHEAAQIILICSEIERSTRTDLSVR